MSDQEFVITVTKKPAPDNFKKHWETFFVYYAEMHYKDVLYKAWGTDANEASEKIKSLVASDKVNGIVRQPGDVVE